MIDTNRNLSFSQLKFWLDCKRQWAYKFRDGYKPTLPPYDFMRGSLLHLGMEYMLRGADVDLSPSCEETWRMAEDTWREEWKIDPEEWVGYDEFVVGARVIVDGALAEFRRDWRVLEDDNGPLLERRFYINDLPPWRGLVFIPDVVAEKLTDPFKGGIFGVDFKSYSKPKEELAGELDLQGAIYQRGLRGKGWDAIGTCLFQLATQPPKQARVNKDGTTNKTDEKAILSWKPVTGQLVTYRSQEFLDGVWHQIVVPTAVEIAAKGGTDAELIPHLDYYGCKFCEFRAPCLARLKGHDEESILAAEFTKRQKGGK